MSLFRKVALRTAALVAVSLASWSAPGWAQGVEFFSPQGEVKAVRQVTARFARAMVPFGDPREVDPFAIDCMEKGKGHWADMKNWVYDFDRDLPAGVRCSFTVKAGVTALDGTDVVEHARLIEEADLAFPVILSSDGRVMDGMHRVGKALLEGRTHIAASRFLQDPEPDHVGVHPDDLPY